MNIAQGIFSNKYAIIANNFSCWSVHTSDIDGDGDLDVLGASQELHNISWFENDGFENFTRITIADVMWTRDMHVADMGSDGDQDIFILLSMILIRIVFMVLMLY